MPRVPPVTTATRAICASSIQLQASDLSDTVRDEMLRQLGQRDLRQVLRDFGLHPRPRRGIEGLAKDGQGPGIGIENEGRVIAALACGFELGGDIACESGFERHMRIPAWLDGMAARVGALLHAGRRRADELPTWKPGLFRFILSDQAIGRRLWTSSKEPRPAPVR